MAVVVPFLVNAGATAMGLSAATATIASVATSVVFQVTGVNDKINRAASKVFGEDLVQFVNIAGAVYGAVNGGFDLDPAKEFFGLGEAAAGGAEAAAAMNVPTGVEAGAAFEAQMAGNGISPISIGDTNVSTGFKLLDTGTAVGDGGAGIEASSLTTGAGSADDVVTRVLEKMGDTDTTLTSTSMMEPPSTSATSLDAAAPTNQAATSSYASSADASAAQSGAAQSGAAKPSATSFDAAAPQETSSGGGIKLNTGGRSGLGLKPPGGQSLLSQKSVFDRVFDKVGDKTIAGLIQGVAAGYGNAQKEKAEQERNRIVFSGITGGTPSYRSRVA